ncbi:MAG: hypothetical protein K1X64_15720 [Myxococcaceae bacterium]|nr:hypothetical protein [Myxococcaceae bacterium]
MASCLVGLLAATAALHDTAETTAVSVQQPALPPVDADDEEELLAPLPITPRAVTPATQPKRAARRASAEDPFSSRR